MRLCRSDRAAVAKNPRGLCFHRRGVGILKDLDLFSMKLDHCSGDGEERLIYFSLRFGAYSSGAQTVG